MSLIRCSECGREFSDRSAACPHCGGPTPRHAAGKSKKEKAAGANGTHVVLHFALVIVLLSLGSQLSRVFRPVLHAAGMAPSARWVVDNAGGDEGCSVLGDYCVRVRCVVTNAGDAAGTARLVATLYEDSGVVKANHTATRYLLPARQDTVVFDFPEAALSKKQSSGCAILR